MVLYGDERYDAALTDEENVAIALHRKIGMAAWHILDSAALETREHTKRHVHTLGPGIRKCLARRR